MRAGESNAFDPVDVVDRFEEAWKVAVWIVRRLVVVDDLPEELDLAPAVRRRLAHLRENVRLRPHPLLPPCIWYDAETTELVAAFDDRDIRACRLVAARDSQRKRHVLVRIQVQHGGRRAALAGGGRFVDEH